MISLQPLTLRRLSPTTALCARCFPTDVGYRWALPLCTMPQDLEELARTVGLRSARQWVATSAEAAVMGTFGLYEPDEKWDFEPGCVVLNWFCVHPEFRGHGFGRRLWEQTVREATALRARRLVFYSSSEPHHAVADHLYVRSGCIRRVGGTYTMGHGTFELTCFELPLNGAEPAAPVQAARIDAALWQLACIDDDAALAAVAEARIPGAAFTVAA